MSGYSDESYRTVLSFHLLLFVDIARNDIEVDVRWSERVQQNVVKISSHLQRAIDKMWYISHAVISSALTGGKQIASSRFFKT